MKKLLNLALALLLPAAVCLPVFAQDEEGAAPKEDASGTASEAPAPKPAPKKAAAKKKAPAKKKKKKPAKPVSEYKFTAADSVPTYKFDKKADPIIKAPKKKKASSKGAAKKAAPAPKEASEETPAEPGSPE